MRAQPNKNFKMDAKCKICGMGFNVTLNENVRVEDTEKYVSGESQPINWFTGKMLDTTQYEKINMYYMVCPNCGCEEKLFYVPTGKMVEKVQVKRY